MFKVKEVLEGLAARLVAENGRKEDVETLKNSVDEMEEAIAKSDNKQYVEANTTFHKAILDGADNSKLSFMLNLLLNQIPYNRYVYLTIEDPKRLKKSLSEHKAILAAIEKGDQLLAEKKMREHVKLSGLQLENKEI
ncbi:GntR family transcriptional regulator [Metabacillus schmidteae]|uniref:GntR family transcriptional regulator n=1 Tax=Metabacillus schmidteae TaxID=2730405 RepID=UPI001F38BA91|nr:FCD domain-containing protein [Metabacillus schmidteae]